MTVTAEDMLSGDKVEKTFDMVVLATGMEPAGASKQIPGVNYIEGFAASAAGVFAAGCIRNPMDVSKSAQDATSAALKAIHAGRGGNHRWKRNSHFISARVVRSVKQSRPKKSRI